VIALTIYSRPGCHLCDEMKALVARVAGQQPSGADVTEVDISGDPSLEERYGQEIPVLMMNGKKVAKFRVSEEELRRVFRAAALSPEP
jgi:glutaredoxin